MKFETLASKTQPTRTYPGRCSIKSLRLLGLTSSAEMQNGCRPGRWHLCDPLSLSRATCARHLQADHRLHRLMSVPRPLKEAPTWPLKGKKAPFNKAPRPATACKTSLLAPQCGSSQASSTCQASCAPHAGAWERSCSASVRNSYAQVEEASNSFTLFRPKHIRRAPLAPEHTCIPFNSPHYFHDPGAA